MALTLKTSGLATNLVVCVAVDDNNTIKEFVNGWTDGAGFTLDTGVAASVATGTWKGSNRKYFETTATSGTAALTWRGLRFTTPPTVNETDSDGCTWWFACAGAYTSHNNLGPFMNNTASQARGVRRTTSSGPISYYLSGGNPRATTTTSLPTDGTTAFSAGITYKSSSSSSAAYGAESGSLSVEATAGSDGGFGSSTRDISAIGGAQDQGSQAFKPYICCVFNKILNEDELRSLHGNGTNDWFSTLFDATSSDVTTSISGSAATPGSGTASPAFSIEL